MRRKAIQLANQTIVVSLPSRWVREQGIKKGDEINIEEKGRELIISSSETCRDNENRVEIDITELDERVIKWFLAVLHKMGYNEIAIKYQRPFSVKIIEKLIKNLFIGFAIIEHNKNRIILKAISKDIGDEFDTALRRAFLVTISMAESSLDLIRDRKFKSLSDVITLEHTNNQLTNFCERILNKYGYKDFRKNYFLYLLVSSLEKICDEYKGICEFLSQYKGKELIISKEIIGLFEDVNNFLKSYYELFYKFDIKKLNVLNKDRIRIEELKKMYYKNKSYGEIIITNNLFNVLTRTSDLSTLIIGSKL